MVAGISFGLIVGIPLILGGGLWLLLLPILATSTAGLIFAFAVLILFVMMLGAVSSATSSIFNVALYNYTLSGRLHGGFSEDDFLFAWVPKSDCG